MFPIKKQFFVKFNINENNKYYQKVFNIIERDISEITRHAQKVVNDYEAGIKSPYTPNWENIINTYFDEIELSRSKIFELMMSGFCIACFNKQVKDYLKTTNKLLDTRKENTDEK